METQKEIVYGKDKPQSIQTMFAKIARNYDRGNAIMSFSMHRLWNAALVREISAWHPSGILLDLCAGTGEIAFNYLKKAKGPAKAVLLDFCGEMLDCAKDKAEKLALDRDQVTFVQADAQAIPLDDHSVDAVTIAYGIRNVKDHQKCIQEAYRVLRPGGHFGILELTRPSSALLRVGHNFYLQAALPLMGRLFLTDHEAYRYLSASIQEFVPADRLERQMRYAGFEETSARELMGGISTLLFGRKPEARRSAPRVSSERNPSEQSELEQSTALERLEFAENHLTGSFGTARRTERFNALRPRRRRLITTQS